MFLRPPKSKIQPLIKIILCLVSLTGLARSQALPFKNYTTADGLGHDFVGRIFRDSQGFLWFGTGEGLSRFDGYEFKNYTQADGLPHRNINDILELDDHTYLIATTDGLAVFDPKGESFKSQSPSSNSKPMFRTFRSTETPFDKQPFEINSLFRKRNGEMLVLTTGRLFRLIRHGDEWQFEKVEIEDWRGKTPEFISMLEDRRGKLWVSTSSGIWQFDQTTRRATLVIDDIATRLIEDREGRVWTGIGDSPKGLAVFTYPEGQDKPVLIRRYTTKDGLTDDKWIHSVFETSDGRILAGIRNGVCEFQPDAKPGEPAFRPISLAGVVSLGEDIGGNLWLGTSVQGAVKLTRRGFVFYDIPEKKPYGTATSIFATSDGEVYATSSASDLLGFDGNKFSEINPMNLKSRSWGSNQLDLRSRIDNEWWIPSVNGLIRYPAVSKFEALSRTPPKKIYTKRDGLLAEDIFRLYEDSHGDLWFSSISKAGIMRWERKTEQIKNYTAADGEPDFSAPTAYGEDSQGNLWIGYYSGGVARLRNGKFDFFPAPGRFPAGLVTAIHNDKNGRLWIAVSNSGVVRVENFSADNPTFVSLSVTEGLSSNQANCLTEDNFGRIYVGTARGINRLEPNTGRLKVFSQADGLPGSNISRCASDSKGNLWFSQRFTLARLTPEKEDISTPPPIFISDLRVNGEMARKLSELGEKSVENLSFNPDQRQIQIGFIALGFGTGETLRYQYKFDNSDWSEPSVQRTVNLNLAPGSYYFLVRAVNSQGVASDSPASVSFSISRPVWQRWWFLLLVILAMGVGIYAIYRYRLKRLIELEKVRTRIATDLHDDIGSSLSQIAILSEVVRQKIGEDGVNKPLNLIAETSRELVDSMSDIVWAINPAKDHLYDLTQRMRRFASDAFEAKEIEYKFELPDNATDISLGADIRREVYLIFKECINNLVKHSKATRAEVKILLDNRFMRIEVADNGCGFELHNFSNQGSEGFGGNGLLSIKQRMKMLQGEFGINTEAGKGTKIMLEIPLKEKKWMRFGCFII